MAVTLRLSGISLRQPLFLQVSQSVHSPSTFDNTFMRSNPLQISVHELRTGFNNRGVLSLPKLVLDLGDDCDALVDVSIDSSIRMVSSLDECMNTCGDAYSLLSFLADVYCVLSLLDSEQNRNQDGV